MQFIITAYDGKDENALARRMEARPRHLENICMVTKTGKVVCAGGITDEEGKPIGSFLILEFPSRELFDEYLKNEPYVTSKVWQDIKVETCNVVILDDHMIGR